MVNVNNVVKINYSVKDVDNSIIDRNEDGKPLEFLIGYGQVIDGLEKAIIGANNGDKLSFKVEPQEGYGIYNPELIQEVAKSQFGDIKLEKGMKLFGQAENGTSVQVVVMDFNDDYVMIDYNHPLAGKELSFDVEIVDIREANEDEIKNGSVVNSCLSDDHAPSSGGCCGGGCGCH